MEIPQEKELELTKSTAEKIVVSYNFITSKAAGMRYESDGLEGDCRPSIYISEEFAPIEPGGRIVYGAELDVNYHTNFSHRETDADSGAYARIADDLAELDVYLPLISDSIEVDLEALEMLEEMTKQKILVTLDHLMGVVFSVK